MRRIVSLRLCAGMALALLLSACNPFRPVVQPPDTQVIIAPTDTPSPISIPPSLTPAPAPLSPQPVPPAPDGASARNTPIFYEVQHKGNTIMVVALDPVRGEERSIADIPFEASADMFLYGVVQPSPDGRRLAVSVSAGVAQQVYLIDGGNVRPILSAEGEHSIGAWSPSGDRFLLFSTKESDRGCIQQTCFFDIYAIDAASGAETRLTATDEAEVDAVWSPDGSQIAFLRGCVDESIDECGPDLYLMNADGSSERLLAEEGWITNPVFLSNDQVAYIRRTGERSDIYRAATNGGAPQPIIDVDTDILSLRVSPDGGMLAFLDQRGDCRFEPCDREVYVVARNGSGLRLIDRIDAWPRAWDWTDDGRLWLLFSGDASLQQLVMYAADGTLLDRWELRQQPSSP